MSIATAITNLQGKIANAYTAIQEKGGTLPQVQNAANLSATIADIPSGGAGSKWGMTLDEICYVDENGYGSILGGISGDLNFPGVRGMGYSQYNSLNGFTRMFARPNIRSASFPDLVSIGGFFESAFYRSTDLTAVSFPVLSAVGGSGMQGSFSNCSSLSSVTFPELQRVGETGAYTTDDDSMREAFSNCKNLTAASFPNLDYIYGYRNEMRGIFNGCSNLVSVSFPKLRLVGGSGTLASAFIKTPISSLDFPELSGIGFPSGSFELALFKDMCTGCSNLVSASFPKLKYLSYKSGYSSTFENTFSSCTSLTAVSFPVLSSMTQYCFKKTFTNCTSLSDFSFPAVTDILAASAMVSTFYNCTSLTSVSFPMLTACVANGLLSNVFTGCTNLTEIHFREDSQSMVEGLTYYSSKWGAPNANCQIYFDL